MTTCKVKVEVRVDQKVMKSRVWPEHDVMKLSTTRAWATRQFNKWLVDFSGCALGMNKIISVYWVARYPDHTGIGQVEGRLSGVNGIQMARTGIFED